MPTAELSRVVFNGFEIASTQQVSGASMLAMIGSVAVQDTRFEPDVAALASDFGLGSVNHIEPHDWYPLIPYLRCLNAIRQRPTGSVVISSIARKIPEKAHFPDELMQMPAGIEKLNAVMEGWDFAYKMNQTGEVGGYTVMREKQIGMARAVWTVTECVPFPQEIGLGVAKGFASVFLAPGTRTNIILDPTKTFVRPDGRFQSSIIIRVL
jgi:hypothetical protein